MGWERHPSQRWARGSARNATRGMGLRKVRLEDVRYLSVHAACIRAPLCQCMSAEGRGRNAPSSVCTNGPLCSMIKLRGEPRTVCILHVHLLVYRTHIVRHKRPTATTCSHATEALIPGLPDHCTCPTSSSLRISLQRCPNQVLAVPLASSHAANSTSWT